MNDAPLQQALTDASSEIDTYLEARFALPLSDPPAVLNRLACDIAMYRLQSLRPLHDLEDARRRYDDAIAMLSKVAAGELTLGLATDNQEPPAADLCGRNPGPGTHVQPREVKGLLNMAAMLDAPWAGSTFSPPTPLDIATIENAILAQLRSQIATIEIAHYPDRPESWRLTHRIGAALVQYKGASYGPQLATAAIIQERRLEFDVTLMMRDLRLGRWRRSGRYQSRRIRDDRGGACGAGGIGAGMPQDVPGAREVRRARSSGRRVDLCNHVRALDRRDRSSGDAELPALHARPRTG